MGYLKIENLYKNQDILLFKECYALEKIHGTSAHITWRSNIGLLTFFSGGASFEHFKTLFDIPALEAKFKELGISDVTIYGEAYGGKQQGMREFYGEDLKFIAFDVKFGDCWLDVPNAAQFVGQFDLEFVWYTRCSTDLETLDRYRDMWSVQQLKNFGKEHFVNVEGQENKRKQGEGIVIRPLIELTKNNGNRIIAKHKGAAFCETKKVRTVNRNEDRLKVLAQVKDICVEWVTENRLSNILSSYLQCDAQLELSDIPRVISLMIEDVMEEGKGELVESKVLKGAIAKETALMIKRRVQ